MSESGPAASGESLEINVETRSGCLLVRPVGVLDSATYLPLRERLVKLAVDEPRAIIVELDRLRVPAETALTVFSSAWLRVSQWPGVPIVLVARDEAQRAMLGGAVKRFVPCRASVEEALAALDEPPLRRRANRELPASPESSRLARDFVREVCADWGVRAELPEAIAVVTELVDNVTRHAGTSSRLRLELRRGMLTIAVWDGSPRPAVVREWSGVDREGIGLRLVTEFARAWGSTPHPRAGKVVWAVLKVARPASPESA